LDASGMAARQGMIANEPGFDISVQVLTLILL
jgi:hypothetical protein